jgi:hypothetical protein
MRAGRDRADDDGTRLDAQPVPAVDRPARGRQRRERLRDEIRSGVAAPVAFAQEQPRLGRARGDERRDEAQQQGDDSLRHGVLLEEMPVSRSVVKRRRSRDEAR